MGDVWSGPDWMVERGDCFELMKTIPCGIIDAIVTDPPYGIGFAAQPTMMQRASGMKPREWDNAAPDVSMFLSVSTRVAIWGGNYFQLPTSRGWIVWTKPDAPPSMSNVEMCWTNQNKNSLAFSLSIAATNPERIGHPTQKPIHVMKRTLEYLGVPEGGLVVDPFMGSGTTGVACIQTGRKFIGFEMDREYCDVAARRLAEVAPLFRPHTEPKHGAGLFLREGT